MLYLLCAGGYFGEIGIILGIPRPASAIASTPIEAYVLRKDTVTTVMQEWPEVAEEWREVSPFGQRWSPSLVPSERISSPDNQGHRLIS